LCSKCSRRISIFRRKDRNDRLSAVNYSEKKQIKQHNYSQPVLADRHAVLIADTAGFGNRSTVICIGAADAVLVPASPGEGDIVEAQKMVAFVRGTAKSIRRDIQVRVLANRIRRGTTLSRHLLAQIDALELPRLETALSEAVAYGELGFAPSLPTTGQAAQEIASLLAELRTLEWLPLALSTV
jgi:cellulose biosynthesis protein BcsQ